MPKNYFVNVYYNIMSHTRRHRRGRKNIINATLNKSISAVKTTSKKYMPKVKKSLEGVGSKVVKTSKQSVPLLRKLTRKLFSLVGIKSRRH